MSIIDIVEGGKSIRDKKRKAKKKANGPEAHCTMEHEGKEYYRYALDYSFQGKRFTVEIWAKSLKEAWKRLYAIRLCPVEINQVLDEGVW